MAKVKLQFPKIYRFFTDLLRSEASKKLKKAFKFQLIFFTFSLLLTMTLFFAFDLIVNLQKDKEQNFQRKILTSQLNTWEGISQKFPNFKEAYYQMAILSYKLGDFEKAKEYVKKALFLDPNFEKARNLQNILIGY